MSDNEDAPPTLQPAKVGLMVKPKRRRPKKPHSGAEPAAPDAEPKPSHTAVDPEVLAKKLEARMQRMAITPGDPRALNINELPKPEKCDSCQKPNEDLKRCSKCKQLWYGLV